jgi:hypothetical protein
VLDPIYDAFFPVVHIVLPRICCIVLLVYTFRADRALGAQRRDRSQRNALLTLAILAVVFAVLYWLPAFLRISLNRGTLDSLLLSPQLFWMLTFVMIGTAATAFYAGARGQRVWRLLLGALALAEVTAIVVLARRIGASYWRPRARRQCATIFSTLILRPRSAQLPSLLRC